MVHFINLSFVNDYALAVTSIFQPCDQMSQNNDKWFVNQSFEYSLFYKHICGLLSTLHEIIQKKNE